MTPDCISSQEHIELLGLISEGHMFRQQTFCDASVFKGEYLMCYVNFRDSLPVDQHLACEEIFAGQSAVLDSILLSLPGAPVR